MFSTIFIKENKDKISLIINNERTKLVPKIKINENYLQVILVKKSVALEKQLIENMSYMFYEFKATFIKFSKMKNRNIIN